METDLDKRFELYAAAQLSLSSARDALRMLGLLPLSNLTSALDNEVRTRQAIEIELINLHAGLRKGSVSGEPALELRGNLVRCPRCQHFFPREPKHICIQVRG